MPLISKETCLTSVLRVDFRERSLPQLLLKQVLFVEKEDD